MALSITSPYQVYFLKYKYIQQLYNAKNILAVARNFCAIYKDPIQANQRSMAFYGTLPWIGGMFEGRGYPGSPAFYDLLWHIALDRGVMSLSCL